MTEIIFAPQSLGGHNAGKLVAAMFALNDALARGACVALQTPRGAFRVPPRYEITQPVIGGCWSLRTPEGMLVRYRAKRTPCPAS